MADPTGLAVVVVDNDAVLTWAGSPTPYVADYSIFRRSPSTGAVFNPAGSPIASGITSLTYADNDLPTGSYDWQVFGRVVVPTVAPTITSPSSTSFTQGTAGTFTVTATGTPAPTLSMTGTLPAGVTFVAGTGVLAGTPTASGTFPLVFTAANGTLPNAVQNFTLTVAGAWTPASLPGLVALWDASNLGTIVAAAGSVSQWNSSVGGFNVLQGTASNQPKTGLHTLNGHNVVTSDGVDDSLVAGGGTVIVAAQPFTVFAVFKLNDAAKGRVFDAFSPRSLFGNSAAGPYLIYSGGSLVNSSLAQTTNPVCQMGLFSGAASKIQVNAAVDTGNAGTNGLGQLFVGSGSATEYASIDTAIIAVCTGDQSASYAQFRTYAQSYWGTP